MTEAVAWFLGQDLVALNETFFPFPKFELIQRDNSAHYTVIA